jgi:hypothetical protein
LAALLFLRVLGAADAGEQCGIRALHLLRHDLACDGDWGIYAGKPDCYRALCSFLTLRVGTHPVMLYVTWWVAVHVRYWCVPMD